ncbi:calcium activated cation channel [Amanita rubescens]|nr:calcium activated cation channel [Amanita rubescens]
MSLPGRNGAEDASIYMARSLKPSQDTTDKLVRRLRAMVLQLLPVEVSPAEIRRPTSRIISPQVVSAFMGAAGDFVETLPYALLRARGLFIHDANRNPADYGENLGRAVACEVLAKSVVHASPRDKLASIMSSRYKFTEDNAEHPVMSSALELAIDQNWFALWRGDIIQKDNGNDDIDYIPYSEIRSGSAWSHFDPSRLGVPKYQNIFRIIVWFIFLVIYSQAVKEPLKRLEKPQNVLDGWEIALYFMTLSFSIEAIVALLSILTVSEFWRLLHFATWRTLNLWNVISLVTDALLFSAFVLRVAGVNSSGEQSDYLRLTSFQVLSCAAPLIWIKLVTIFDGYKFIGTLEICVTRMLKESGIFFALLSVLSIGFFQGLYGLDAADGNADDVWELVNLLIQSLLQSPNFSKFGSPIGLMIYYLWTTVTVLILLNVLISLFSSAYSDIVQDAEAQYLAFFANKTISMIRAPDSYVYPAPFNLLEVILVAPFEFIPCLKLSSDTYAQLNRYVMGFIFFVPLSVIALHEAARETKRGSWMEHWFLGGENEQEPDSPQIRNPEVDDPGCPGKQISRVPFEELIKVFPNTQQSIDATILEEMESVKAQLSIIMNKLNNRQTSGFGL